MLAELVDHVIGIDPDRDWITAAVLDAKTTGVIATAKFAANNDGYDEAIEWADTHTTAGDRSWVVEGSGSYGRGLSAALSRVGEWVIEFDRPHQRPTKDGAKSDELDAVRAAREALGRHKLHTPRSHDGHREALRVHTVTREGVVRARTAAINELKALVLTSPDGLRSELRGLTTTVLIRRCAAFRTVTKRPVAEQCVRNTMRVVARRIQHFNDEIEVHDVAMKQLVDDAAPQLVCPTRCRLRHRSDVHHRVVTPRSMPIRSGLRTTRWRRSAARDLRAKPGPASSQQIRRPETQPGLPHGRARSHAPSRTHQGLHRETSNRGQDRPRNPTLPQALHRPKRLATPRAPEPTNHRLTDIEGSSHTRRSGAGAAVRTPRGLHGIVA